MGLAGLTAVFGMGTGVTPPVWSPGIRPAGVETRPAAWIAAVVTGKTAFGLWSLWRSASFSSSRRTLIWNRDPLPAFSRVNFP